MTALPELLWSGLSKARDYDARLTFDTVAHWLEFCDTSPDISFVEDQAHVDARFWASFTRPQVLEAYLIAALLQLEASALTGKAAKRMTALGWSQMSEEDKARFRAWISKDSQDG